MYKKFLSLFIVYSLASCTYQPLSPQRTPSSLKSSCKSFMTKLFKTSNKDPLSTQELLREDINYEQLKKNITLKPGAIVERKLAGDQKAQYVVDVSNPEVKAIIEEVTTSVRQMKPDEKIQFIDEYIKRLVADDKVRKLDLRQMLSQTTAGSSDEPSCVFCGSNSVLYNVILSEVNLRPQLNYYKVWRKVGNNYIEEEYGINTLTVDGKRVIFDPSIKDFHMKDINGFLQTQEKAPHQMFGIVQRSQNPIAFLPTKKVNELEFNVKLSDSETNTFNIVNRNKAGKKFRQEAQSFEDAGPDDDVDIEWIFTPYYVPLGHTNLRIGNSLYEFTSQGWKMHDNGGLTAETFIFNNGFFKKQYQAFKSKGMPPYSIGTSFTMKKREIIKFLASIESHDPQVDSFSLLTRNCNQCAIDELKKVNFDAEKLSGSRFQEFSSVWTFRRLLHSPPFPIKESNVYHLSGDNEPTQSFQSTFPTYLFKKHTVVDEVLRIIRGLNDRRKMQ
jgi:hypothetical protein